MTDVNMEWFGDDILKITKVVMNKTSKEIATNVTVDAAIVLKARAKTTTEKGLLSQFSVEKSKFPDGGYLAYNQGPGNVTGKYHSSFVELGTFKDVAIPFMRIARKMNKKKATKIYQRNLDREMLKT